MLVCFDELPPQDHMADNSNNSPPWRNPNHATNDASQRAAESVARGDVLRQKLKSGRAIGTFLIELPTRGALSALALAGFDFVVIDTEHSAIDFSTLDTLIAAGNAAGITMLVRPWTTEPGFIGKVLDIGAHGVMAAHVDTAERAREVVAAARFSPQGTRGFSPLARYDALREPLQALNDATFVVVQIEGREGLARVSDIAAVPGIDALFVGPYDLALSMQVTPGSAQVFEAAQRIAQQVPSHVQLGIYLDDPAQSGAWAARGFRLQCLSFDGRMFANAARNVVDMALKSLPSK
jgi:2-keto-3-deoxy-L-rhamnonate aldolase RhmA